MSFVDRCRRRREWQQREEIKKDKRKEDTGSVVQTQWEGKVIDEAT